MPEATQPTEQPQRNHGLFSDHYLNVTLPGRPGWESLVEQARLVMEEISNHFTSFTPSANEAQTDVRTTLPDPLVAGGLERSYLLGARDDR
jgi:hypothetical protein